MSEHPRTDAMHEIEGKHFGRCIDQMWDKRRLNLIELMEWPKGKSTVILVKQFERPVPRHGSGKAWPDLLACYVYAPIDGKDSMTWEGLDKALTEIEASR